LNHLVLDNTRRIDKQHFSAGCTEVTAHLAPPSVLL
jgi:hypothetical protein